MTAFPGRQLVQSVELPPEQVRQEGSHPQVFEEVRKEVEGQLRHWFAKGPEQVAHEEWQLSQEFMVAFRYCPAGQLARHSVPLRVKLDRQLGPVH